jgi:hypothetical protein
VAAVVAAVVKVAPPLATADASVVASVTSAERAASKLIVKSPTPVAAVASISVFVTVLPLLLSPSRSSAGLEISPGWNSSPTSETSPPPPPPLSVSGSWAFSGSSSGARLSSSHAGGCEEGACAVVDCVDSPPLSAAAAGSVWVGINSAS